MSLHMGRQKNSKDEWSIEDNQPTLCQFKKLYTVIIIVMSVQGNNAVVFCRKTKMRVCVAGSQLELNHVLPSQWYVYARLSSKDLDRRKNTSQK